MNNHPQWGKFVAFPSGLSLAECCYPRSRSEDLGPSSDSHNGLEKRDEASSSLHAISGEGLSLAEASCFGILINIGCKCCGTRQKADLTLLMRQYEPATKLTAAFQDYSCLKCWKRGEFTVFVVKRERSV